MATTYQPGLLFQPALANTWRTNPSWSPWTGIAIRSRKHARLRGGESREAIRWRHARHCLEQLPLETAGDVEARLRRLEAVRAALDWAIGIDDDVELRINLTAAAAPRAIGLSQMTNLKWRGQLAHSRVMSCGCRWRSRGSPSSEPAPTALTRVASSHVPMLSKSAEVTQAVLAAAESAVKR